MPRTNLKARHTRTRDSSTRTVSNEGYWPEWDSLNIPYLTIGKNLIALQPKAVGWPRDVTGWDY